MLTTYNSFKNKILSKVQSLLDRIDINEIYNDSECKYRKFIYRQEALL